MFEGFSMISNSAVFTLPATILNLFAPVFCSMYAPRSSLGLPFGALGTILVSLLHFLGRSLDFGHLAGPLQGRFLTRFHDIPRLLISFRIPVDPKNKGRSSFAIPPSIRPNCGAAVAQSGLNPPPHLESLPGGAKRFR